MGLESFMDLLLLRFIDSFDHTEKARNHDIIYKVKQSRRSRKSMSEYKYSVKNTIRIEREKLSNVALSYSTIDAAEPSEYAKKLVEEYIAGNMEIADIQKTVIEKYRSKGLGNT